MNNTRFTYLYRDGSNCKKEHSEVLRGQLRSEEIVPYLDEGAYFIASQVGLEDLQWRWPREGFALSLDHDHAWHEVVALALTDETPTISLTAHELRSAFANAKWDESAVMARLGLPRR